MAFAALPLLLLQPAATPPGMPDAPPAELVVIAHVPHCLARNGDPADAVDTTRHPGDPEVQVIRPDWKTGELGLFLDDYPVTGPSFWQRNGSQLDAFRFRVPDAEDGPYCIGSKHGYPGGFASLRRSFDAAPYHGKVVRFTAWVATWRAGTVIFWLAGGSGKYHEGVRPPLGTNIVAGDNSEARPIKGTHGWMPISYTIGPIPCETSQISYGILLDGGGDVWFYKPRFEVVPREELRRSLNKGQGRALCKKSLF